MTIHDELINEIKQLPDEIILAISLIVKELLVKKSTTAPTLATSDQNATKDSFAEGFPLYGCAKGKVRMSDDFDAPLEEMEDYI